VRRRAGTVALNVPAAQRRPRLATSRDSTKLRSGAAMVLGSPDAGSGPAFSVALSESWARAESSSGFRPQTGSPAGRVSVFGGRTRVAAELHSDYRLQHDDRDCRLPGAQRKHPPPCRRERWGRNEDSSR